MNAIAALNMIIFDSLVLERSLSHFRYVLSYTGYGRGPEGIGPQRTRSD